MLLFICGFISRLTIPFVMYLAVATFSEIHLSKVKSLISYSFDESPAGKNNSTKYISSKAMLRICMFFFCLICLFVCLCLSFIHIQYEFVYFLFCFINKLIKSRNFPLNLDKFFLFSSFLLKLKQLLLFVVDYSIFSR